MQREQEVKRISAAPSTSKVLESIASDPRDGSALLREKAARVRDQWLWFVALGRPDGEILNDMIRTKLTACGCRKCVPHDPQAQARVHAEHRDRCLAAVTGHIGSFDRHPLVVGRRKRIARARGLCEVHQPAIQGQGGSSTTFALAVSIVRGLMIAPEIAVVLIDEIYSPRCMPPWSWPELFHKAEDAEYRSDRPWGFLLSTCDGGGPHQTEVVRDPDAVAPRENASGSGRGRAVPPPRWRSPSVSPSPTPGTSAP